MKLSDIPYTVESGPVTIEGFRLLHGANYFSGGPVIMFTINLNQYHEVFTNEIPGFYEKLSTLLPSLVEHHCSEGVRGGFFSRVKDGTLLGHVMEHISIELQDLAGMHVSYGKTRSTLREGVYNVIFRFRDEIAGSIAGIAALNLINSILTDKAFELAPVIHQMIDIREKRLLGPTTQSIADCATSLGIPWLRLDEYNLIQLGTGKYQQRIRSSLTGSTPALALDIIADRQLTMQMLADAGIPVPVWFNLSITGSRPETRGIIYPRFRDQNESGGAVFFIPDVSSIPTALGSPETLFINTTEMSAFRFLVIGGQISAVCKVIPPFVTGDGNQSIASLIAHRNLEPGRERGDKGALSLLEPSPEMQRQLDSLQLTFSSVPNAGEIVLLGATANPTNGSETEAYQGAIHNSVSQAVLRAVRMLGPDVAGVDVYMINPANAFGSGEGIFQIVAAPNFRMHLKPSKGESVAVALPFIKSLFPEGAPTHAPLIAVTGSRGKTTFLTILQQAMKPDFPNAAVLSSIQLSLGPTLLSQDCEVSAANARLLMRDPATEIILAEISAEMIGRTGLPYDFADMAVVLNVDPDETEMHGYHEPDDLAYAKSVVAEQVYENGLVFLNAADPLVAAIAERIENKIVWFADTKPEVSTLKNCLACVYGGDGHIMLWRNGRETILAYSDEIALHWKNDNHRIADAALAAMAVCISLPTKGDDCLKRLIDFLKQ